MEGYGDCFMFEVTDTFFYYCIYCTITMLADILQFVLILMIVLK